MIEPPRLSSKSLQVLQLIAAGHSYAQIVDSHMELNYHDIFFAAEEAVWLDERLASGSAGPSAAKPSGSSAMERAKAQHPRAYAPWTEGEEAELRSLHAGGLSAKEIAETLQRQASAIRSRLSKMGLV